MNVRLGTRSKDEWKGQAFEEKRWTLRRKGTLGYIPVTGGRAVASLRAAGKAGRHVCHATEGRGPLPTPPPPRPPRQHPRSPTGFPLGSQGMDSIQTTGVLERTAEGHFLSCFGIFQNCLVWSSSRLSLPESEGRFSCLLALSGGASSSGLSRPR